MSVLSPVSIPVRFYLIPGFYQIHGGWHRNLVVYLSLAGSIDSESTTFFLSIEIHQ